MQKDVNKIKKMIIMGYPGEINKIYQLWGMESNENNQNNITIENNENIITYNDIDTSKGQSGSPIIICNDNNQNQIQIIGVHTNGSKSKAYNFGTLFNHEKFNWIANCMNCYHCTNFAHLSLVVFNV